MKIRNGFVANSSTTSFCICGIELDVDDNVDIDIKKFEDLPDIDTYIDPSDEYLYIGLSIESMKDEETLLEFKTRAFNLIKKYYDIKLEQVSLITEAWVDC